MRLLTACADAKVALGGAATQLPAPGIVGLAEHLVAAALHTPLPLASMKYVLVSGGVVSGLGKGVTASSIGVILKNCGHRVTSVKIGSPAACSLLSARQLAFTCAHSKLLLQTLT